MSQLDGKAAVITGAGSGTGLAAVRLFAGEGARVYAGGHPADGLKDSLAAIGGEVTVVDCDTADPADAASLKDMAPAIVGAASMMLDRVRAGELGRPPADDAADSIRNGWL